MSSRKPKKRPRAAGGSEPARTPRQRPAPAGARPAEPQNLLYYGDNLEVMRRYIKDDSIDLIYLDPPFNSSRDYNVIFAEQDGSRSKARQRNRNRPMTDSIYPEMVIIAREGCDLTQGELGDLIGYTQTRISKIENGLRPLPPEHLPGLAKALGQAPAFFSTRPPQRVMETGCYHRRSLRTAPIRKLKAIDRQVDILQVRIEGLLHGLKLDVFSGFEPIEPDETTSAEDIARQLRRRWGLASGPILQLSELVERCGGVVVLMEFATPKDDGRSFHNPPGLPVIVVNRSKPGDRQRWIIAHEVGHLIMHAYGSAGHDAEREADRFAAEFLMPEEDIKPELYHPITLERLTALKHRWRVSIQALARRAKDLGVISESRFGWMMSEISSRGWRTREPVSVEQERPTLIDAVIRHHRENRKLTLAEVAGAAKADLSSFCAMFLPGQSPMRVLGA
ncbi:MAG: ImmA/IrrE family metallo-endopeptidase [Planctomycetota bacterium]|nr:MAG: ImmA/IrrE family metallo-endopeptidase [Planctomycetota bacterium]